MNLLCWAMAPSSRVTRKWEVFAGRNKFYCDGFLISAPHTGVFYFTVFLITFTSTLFFAFDCPFLADRITLAIPIIGGCLFLFTMGALLRTTFTDPGIIPRASQDEAAYIEKQIEVPNSLNSPTFRPPPRTKEVLVKGQTVKLKYCFTCKIFRPPRASHCSLCDNCVDRFDHHCPWVGNCVGKRNYRFFYMFIVSLAFLAVFIFSCSLTHLILLAKEEEKQEFVEVIRQAPFSLVSSFICFMSIWSVIGLAGFHTYLTTSDQTTNEDIKGSFSSKGGAHNVNPYSHGNICLNCFYIICGPMTPSLIDRRGIVTDEYRVQMQQAERFNTPTLHVPIIAQPVTANDQSNKINYYDIESGPPTLLSSGVYRQRSYDNLHNGNSASVDQLIENELPLSTLHSPVSESGNVTEQQRSTAIMSASDEHLHTAQLDADEDVDDANMDSMNNQNHLSGSYSNLFRADRHNDEAADEVDPATELAPSEIVDAVAGVASPALPRENVYSNVPFVGAPSMLMQSPERPNPSMHVYSNVVNPTTATPSTATALHDFSFGGVSAILATNASGPSPPMSDDSLQVTRFDRQSSSTMLADDLDLDDPVTVAGTFGQTPSKKHRSNEPSQAVGTSTTNGQMATSSQALNSAKKTGTTLEMTNVIPQVNVLGAGDATAATANASFCSPSRLRLLHDTTMIDTALDLDSLDGSSMGNTSQACLVKTAIV